MNEKLITIYDQIDQCINDKKFTLAIELIYKVIFNQVDELTSTPLIKIQFASLYIDIADLAAKMQSHEFNPVQLTEKSLIIFKQLGNKCPDASLFIKTNRARALMIQFDHSPSFYEENPNEGNDTFDRFGSIYLIKKTISETIRLYWEALNECTDESEKYNIRNNLANALSRVGRRIESIILLRENILQFPERWQSHVSLVHALRELQESALIMETPSFHLLSVHHIRCALKSTPELFMESIKNDLAYHETRLSDAGFEVSEEILERNYKEEQDHFSNHTEYRKYVLLNNLSLSEHSIHCNCHDSTIDNLKIGMLGGSLHIGDPKLFPFIDGLVNRLISEFCFSRLLYYNYVHDNTQKAEDVEFSNLSNNDLTGYKIEHLRTSYRLAYAVLDKIKEGIVMLFDLKEEIGKNTYFESFFDGSNKAELAKINNTHLTALYSLALDLNRGNGSFKHYKIYRNEMEHGFLAINELSEQKDLMLLKPIEMDQLTFELLKLTRTAIFNFVFLVRTTTIQSIYRRGK